MPRPRTVSDEAILMGAARVMAQVPPGAFTLALVSAEVGLSPATLVQRFGSKLGLLRALASAGAEGMTHALAAVQQQHRSPVRAIEAYLGGFANLAPTAEVLANNLAYLQLDLTEPELREPTRAMFEAHERNLRVLISAAVDQGELVVGNARALARTLLAVVQGTLILWGVNPSGSAVAAIRREVRAVLESHVTAAR